MPRVQHADHYAGRRNLAAFAQADLVEKIEGAVAHLPDSHADVNLLGERKLALEIALGVGNDEVQVAGPDLALEIEPVLGATPFEVGEEYGVVDVSDGVEITPGRLH